MKVFEEENGKEQEEKNQRTNTTEIFLVIERRESKTTKPSRANEYKHWHLIMNGKRSNKVVDLRRLQTCALSYIFIATPRVRIRVVRAPTYCANGKTKYLTGKRTTERVCKQSNEQVF